MSETSLNKLQVNKITKDKYFNILSGTDINQENINILKNSDAITIFTDDPWKLDAKGTQISGVGDPQLNSDAANKKYVDEKLNTAISGVTAKTFLGENNTDKEDSTILNTFDAKNGDFAIISHNINDSTKTQRTAYIYNTNKWEALDGNYDASNVYFKDNIGLAGTYTQVGNFKKSNEGSVVHPSENGAIKAKGKSLEEVFKDMFWQDTQPTATKPSISNWLKYNSISEQEVGSTVTPSLAASSLTFYDGEFSFGPKVTGCRLISLTPSKFTETSDINNSAFKIGAMQSTNDDTFKPTITLPTFKPIVLSDKNDFSAYTFTMTAEYSGSTVKSHTKLSANSDVTIPAGSLNSNEIKFSVSTYRKTYIGVFTKEHQNIESLTSKIIRDGTLNIKTANGKTINEIQIGPNEWKEGTLGVWVAYPKDLPNYKKLTKVLNVGTNTELKDFKEATCSIDGATTGFSTNYVIKYQIPALWSNEAVYNFTFN